MSTAVKERPIIFGPKSIRSIQDNTKTETRRLSGLQDVNAYTGRLEGMGSMGPLGYKGLDPSDYYRKDKAFYRRHPELCHRFVGQQDGQHGEINPIPVRCPYGAPGSRLWVREAAYIALPDFGDPHDTNCIDTEDRKRLVGYACSMDGDARRCAEEFGVKLSSPIHMPRWAARLLLEVVSIGVERLQEITEEGAIAEGVRPLLLQEGQPGCWWTFGAPNGDMIKSRTARGAFAAAWNELNGKRAPWESNPWVWKIAFRRLTP